MFVVNKKVLTMTLNEFLNGAYSVSPGWCLESISGYVDHGYTIDPKGQFMVRVTLQEDAPKDYDEE